MPLLLAPMLITILAVIMYLALAFNVGRARGKYKVQVPAVSGHEHFERYYRVQMNTLEQLVAFLPALWVYALIWHSHYTILGLGFVWIATRIGYAVSYYHLPAKRGKWFVISLFVTAFLLLGSLVGIVKIGLGL